MLNTVKRARAVYSAIKNESGAPKNVLLIHSRFRPYERSGAHDKDGKVERSGRGPAAVTLLHPGTSDLHSFEYRRSRNRRNDDGWNRAHGFFRLEFENEILGPLSLGYASHYGMGHFRPV